MPRAGRFLFAVLLVAGAFAPRPAAASGAAFSAPRPFQVGSAPVDAVIADVDGDGVMDLVTADASGQHVVSIGLGPTPPATAFGSDGFPLAGAPDDIAAGLFDANNRADIVSVVGGSLVVSISDGKVGGFLTFTHRTPMSAGADVTLKYVKTGDFDGDGFTDIVATGTNGPGGGTVAVFLNDHTGQFAAPVLKTTGQPCGDFALADITRDGRRDVIVTHFAAEAAGILVNDGAGGLGDEIGVDNWGRPTSVGVGDVTGDGVPDLVVGGIGMGGDAPDEYIYLNVYQNLAALDATAPSLGTGSIFQIFHSTSNDLSSENADIAMIDAAGDARSEIAVTHRYGGAVRLVTLSATTNAQGVATSWSFTTDDFPCNASPWRVTAGDVDGDGETDLVTANLAGNGINYLRSGSGTVGGNAGPAAKNLTLAKAKGGKYVGNAPMTFRVDAGSTASDLAIALEATTTPEVAGSWIDVADGGFVHVLAPPKKAGWFATTTEIHGGTWYFRTVSTASGFDPGINTDLPSSGSDTRYIGPVTVQPGPAKFHFTATLRRFAGSGPVHRGENALGTFVYSNDGDSAADGVFVVARVPDGCTLADAGGTSTVLGPVPGYAIWGPLSVPGHSSDAFQYHVLVGPDAGTTIQSVGSGVGRVTLKKGKPKIVGAVADSNSLAVEGELGVDVTPYVPTAAAGAAFATSFTITNRTNYAVAGVSFVEHLPRDVQFLDAEYIDAQNHLVVSPLPSVNAAHDAVAYDLGTLAPDESRKVFLNLRVRYDRAPEGTIALQSYTLSGHAVVGGAAVSGDGDPPAAGITVSGPSTTGVPRLGLVAGVDTGHESFVSQKFGEVEYALPGDELTYGYFFNNVGDADAENCVLTAVMPAGADIVPGSGLLDGNPIALDPAPGSAFDVPVGRLVNQLVPHALLFRVTVRAAGAAGAAAAGDVIVTKLASISSESLVAVTPMAPAEIRVLISQPVEFDVRKSVSASTLSVGDPMEIRYTIRNGGTFGAHGIVAAFGLPKFEEYVSATLDGVPVTQPASATKTLVKFDIDPLAADASSTLAVTVRLAKRPPLDAVLVNTLDVTGAAGPSKTDNSGPASHDDEYTNVSDPSRARVFVVLAANTEVALDDSLDSVIAVGNTSDQTAKNVVITMLLPEGTHYVDSFKEGLKLDAKKRLVSWRLGDIAPHAAVSRVLIVDTDASVAFGTSIVQEAVVTCDNAQSKVSGRVTTTLRQFPAEFAPQDASRAFLVNGATYRGHNDAIDAGLASLGASSATVQLGGADLVALDNGVGVIPMGAGKALAFGRGTTITASTGAEVLGGLLVSAGNDTSAGFYFIAGDASAIGVSGISCANVATVGSALDQLAGLVPCKAATIVGNGVGNLVNATGTALVPNSASGTASLISLVSGANIVASGAGNIVASGAGNIVASGAGNIVAQGGGNVTAAGNGRTTLLIGGQIVATGGGNIISTNGGGIVAQGGGNIVAQGGGNIISTNGGGIVAQGGGNIVAQGGGN